MGTLLRVTSSSLLWFVGRRHHRRADVALHPRPASRLDIRRWYTAWRSLLMPALLSVSSGVVVGSGKAGKRADSSAGAIQPTTARSFSRQSGQKSGTR